ncbi:MAG: C-GCAxxG-C-C family protein [Anaerolineae bacterium]|nr:C-GCAxxG-C-C family protein [Anaerolineae bacterium]
MNPNEKATELFAEGYSCSQSLLVSRAEQFGLSAENALKVSAAFGGGLGRQGEVCGAISGALMVIGLAHGQTTPQQKEAKEHTYQLTRRFIAEFTRRTGALHCSNLLGCQIGTPEGLQQAQEQSLFKTVCPRLVAEASQILDEILNEN